MTAVTSNGVPIKTEANGISVSGTDVYLAGKFNGSATYWKNGKATTLSVGGGVSEANAIVVVAK